MNMEEAASAAIPTVVLRHDVTMQPLICSLADVALLRVHLDWLDIVSLVYLTLEAGLPVQKPIIIL